MTDGISPLCDMHATLRQRGITCTVSEAGKLQVRPSSALNPTDRDWLKANAVALVELIRAIDDMHDADTAVCESGVSGTHPEIAACAEAVCAAFRSLNLRGVRNECERMNEIVKRLAPTQTSHAHISCPANPNGLSERASDAGTIPIWWPELCLMLEKNGPMSAGRLNELSGYGRERIDEALRHFVGVGDLEDIGGIYRIKGDEAPGSAACGTGVAGGGR